MNDRFRFRVWDKEKKLMYPSWSVWKTYFGDMETWSLVLMQSTGLRDKNGALIYEGDVIRGNLFDRHLPTKGEVVYDTENACFANKNLAGLTFLFKINKIEVIGNVHDNPDLIGGE